MQNKWKVGLIAAPALLLLLVVGIREGLRAPSPVVATADASDAVALVEEQRLAPAPDTVTAERRDLAELDAALELEHTEPTANLAAEGFSLRVTLRELDGAPLAPGSAHVWVVDAAGQRFARYPDTGGVALLADLAPGRWWVRGSATGRMTETRELHLPSSDAGLELELRLAPRPHVRIVVLTPDGRPFADALSPSGRILPYATASRRCPEGWLGDALEAPRWNDCGTFVHRTHTEREPALLGRIELDCARPLWVSLHLNEHVLQSQLLEPGIDELRFFVDPDTYPARFAELVLRVVDADGARPLTDATGTLQVGPRHSYGGAADGESRLRFSGVMAGRVSLELSAPGYAARVLELSLEPGERKDLGDVELSSVGAGTLQLVIHGGVGASDVTVTWLAASELRIKERGGMTFDTAPVEGDMLELELAHGEWGVWASAQRHGVELRSRLQPVAMEGGRVAAILTLEPVATLLLEPVGRPIEVWVQTPDGLLAHDSKLHVDDLPLQVTLAPGSYTLLLREQGREDRTQHLELTAAGASLRLQ